MNTVNFTSNSIPSTDLISDLSDPVSFKKIEDTAQYKGSDYANAVRVERGISVDQALEIAANDPNIDYFFIVKGFCLVLEFEAGQPYNPEKDPLHLVREGRFRFDDGRLSYGYMRVFNEGDAVFFKNEGKWLGSAAGLADVYEKN